MKPSSHKVSPKSRSYTVTKFLSKKVTLFESLSRERGSALAFERVSETTCYHSGVELKIFFMKKDGDQD